MKCLIVCRNTPECGFHCLSRGCGVLKMSDVALKMSDVALKYNIKDTGRDVSSHLRIEMTMPEMRAL